MKFREIAESRVTGLSCPIFGVSWEPPESERTVARRVIAFLEDRRVLYVPGEGESPEHCVRSVIEIRQFLTEELGKIEANLHLSKPSAAIRAACRKFVSVTEKDRGVILRNANSHMHYASFTFSSALGELRGVAGIHIAMLAATYGLDVENDLASIFPESDSGA
jgi:hypothetical protein